MATTVAQRQKWERDRMDAITAAALEPVEVMLAVVHREDKRESGYARMKRRALKAEGALAEARKASASENEDEEAAEEPDKPRRETQNKRLKRKNQYLQGEITALESLAHRLLNHLEAATSGDLTAQQRQGYRNLVADVRRNLSPTE